MFMVDMYPQPFYGDFDFRPGLLNRDPLIKIISSNLPNENITETAMGVYGGIFLLHATRFVEVCKFR